jgi:pimeloyl-ACP methyl ester carboxylesterase
MGVVDVPDIRYARSGDVAIAYQCVGTGPIDIVFVRGFAGDLLSVWEQPLLVRFIEDLAKFARVIMLDKRGTGLSDRVREVPTLETRMDDVRAVMDDAHSDRAIMWSAQEGVRPATLFAATYPERVAGLVLFDPTAKGRRTDDYPWALTDEQWRARLKEIRDGWGRTEFLDACLAEWSPKQRDDQAFRAWFIAHMRRSLSPGSALAFFRMTMDSDVGDLLPTVRVPAVILSSPSERGPGEYFARRIPGARLVDLPTLRSIYHWVDEDAHEIAMRETRRLAAAAHDEAIPERTLATVLFTDIVDSTASAAEPRRSCLGRSSSATSRRRPRPARPLPWSRGRHRRRRLSRHLRRSGARDLVWMRDRREGSRAWPEDSRWRAYRRVRAGRREGQRSSCAHRGARRRSGAAG